MSILPAFQGLELRAEGLPVTSGFPAQCHRTPPNNNNKHARSPISPSLRKVSSICGYGESDPADAVRAPFGLVDPYVGGKRMVGGGGGEMALECHLGLSSIVKHHRARSFSFAILQDAINNMQSQKELVLLDAKE